MDILKMRITGSEENDDEEEFEVEIGDEEDTFDEDLLEVV